MFKTIRNFYKTSAPVEPLNLDEKAQTRYYRKLSLQAFAAGTLGYSFYYVCRAAINVMKKPIIDSGLLDADQLGTIGAVSLAAYAIGKFVNGFLADYSNIKRFMATGLIISALACFLMGMSGLIGAEQYSALIGTDPTSAQNISFLVFIAFAILWGLSGWGQSMGAPPAIIALSRWFPLSRRGTFYGFFSASHNIGEGLSFIFVGSIVAAAGWQWGFFGAAIAGVIGILTIIFFLHDTPESKGLPSIEVLAHEKIPAKQQTATDAQRIALRTPAVWILALASAFMYISRYSLNSWGVLFMQEKKGFELLEASTIISINAWMGVVGTVLAGWMSDVLFKGDRKIPALVSGILLSISYAMFIYCGNGGTVIDYWITVISMALFGIAIGVLIAFLGGLMAVDIVPRKATGAALGVVGMVSYAAASLQEKISGYLINSNITETVNELGEVVKHYDFSDAAIFWIGASVISFLLPILNWGRKVQQDEE
ncbi:MAG: MFS transporter [Rikenellaceae bacterium]|nr:MFS transporter [Rikenellaceae bacterium]